MTGEGRPAGEAAAEAMSVTGASFDAGLVNRPDGLAPPAGRVLDHPWVELPDSARCDVHAGRVCLHLLDVLAVAAAQDPVSVAVLPSVHPHDVYCSTRLSDHAAGPAVDVWERAGQPVITTGVAEGAAGKVKSTAFADPLLAQAGSPVGSDLDGPGRRQNFVNLVHREHLHLAARGPDVPTPR